jgi:transposase-like protein
MRGTIISDETWYGPDPKWMHANKRPGRQGVTYKTPVLSLVNAVTGEVRSRVIPTVSAASLRKVISEQVDMANSVLWTDDGVGYMGGLGAEFAAHAKVNHSAGQYVHDGMSTNMVEGYFAQLKRSLDGTHHHVSKEHLHRYLGEFDFRYETCKMSDSGRMRTLGKQMEGRLSYKRVVSNH